MSKFKEDIIKPWWELTSKSIDLKKFYLFPWILSIIFITWLLVYQTVYTYVEVFDKQTETLSILLDFFHSQYFISSLIIVLVFILIYFLSIPIFESWLIFKIDAKARWKECTTEDALSKWMLKFLQIFKFNNIFSEFKFLTLVNLYLFSIRFIWIEYIKNISYVFLIVFVFSLFINILSSYSKFFIILDNAKIFESISKSLKISIINISTTIKLYLLMFILSIRVLVNFFVILLIPIWIISALTYISSQFFLAITLIIIILSAIFLIFILWYLTSVLEIFRTSVWYFAFKNCKKRLDDLEEK